MARVGVATLLKTKDALNGQLMLDHQTNRKFSRTDPHFGVMDLNRPFRVSRNVKFPTPMLSTVGAWIAEGDEVSPIPEE